jgi:5'-methylthioadenosine phosphorylase
MISNDTARTQATGAEIGIIGGSGLYDLEVLEGREEIRVATPYGDPSDSLVVGMVAGRRVAFVPRHGRGHGLAPAEIPVRANIYALKLLGVGRVVSVSAVGSLREDFAPGHLVVPDQLVDRTRGDRPSSFFGDGLVVHVPFAEPYCERLRRRLADAARRVGRTTVHDAGTYCCMEGPQFSTRAESELHRRLGMDLIGMTALPEAKLAREAELCYAALALVTDYDCWYPEHESVTADMVAEVMRRNTAAAQDSIVALVESLAEDRDCPCDSVLAHAILTDREAVPEAVRERTKLLVGKYLGG